MKEADLNQIERYIAGLSDDNEKAWVESLFLNGPDHEILRQALLKSWDSIPDDPTPDVNLDHILLQIHRDINRSEASEKPTPFRRFAGGYRKVAAVLFLPLLLSAGFFFNKLQHPVIHTLVNQEVASTIYAPMGSRVSFSLPDGTTGMLNSGSKLSYSLPFTNKRKVSLEGEAWFDVQKDAEHPFELNTGNSTVKVLGTSFNVSAYPAENYVEVVLKEGKVEFMDNQGDEVAMRPSERLVYRNGRVGKAVADPAKYQAWTKGRMVFNNDPMAEVARRIERWYNVKVVLADKELEKYSFRGTFEDDKLDEVFRLLSLTSPITYKITPRTLHADGSYEKEIVTIHLIKR
ncbi:MAG: DUF4974 domain-containing protein [Bacteroidales bacterium]|nr:DUF4974 domain-containing protein [Bacteroidales bacterium]